MLSAVNGTKRKRKCLALYENENPYLQNEKLLLPKSRNALCVSVIESVCCHVKKSI